MFTIISTVGTSVFGKLDEALRHEVQKFDKSELDGAASTTILNGKDFPGQNIHNRVIKRLKEYSSTPESLRQSCAELNAIEGIHALHSNTRNNEYVFLASQTLSGMLAARILADFCATHYTPVITSKATLIQGLQVAEPHKFRLTGLPYLIQTVYKVIDSAKKEGRKVVINPTGGFKAAIPYLTLVGMLRRSDGVEISCIHESSQELITLAGLPIVLDFEGINAISSVLSTCNDNQQTGISSKDLRTDLPLHGNESLGDHPFWALFEAYDDDHYILSGLGSIALAELTRRQRKQPVWLSKQAADTLDKTPKGSVARTNYETILNRIGDPDHRAVGRHEYKGSQFPAYKYKGNERLFYYDDQGKGDILILELTRHVSDNDYSYEKVPTALKDYQPHRKWKDS